MATNAKLGNAMLLQIADTAGGSTYTTIGALRANTITLNKATVDITNKDGNGWSEVMAGGGVKSASISGSGIFTDNDSAQDLLLQAYQADTNWNFRLIHADLNVWVGSFNIDSYVLAGDVNDAETYEITLSSADVTTYTTYDPVAEAGAQSQGGAPDPRTTLTVTELNTLLTADGLTPVDTAVFDFINGSDEAQYNVEIGPLTDIVYVVYDVNNNMVAYYTL